MHRIDNSRFLLYIEPRKEEKSEKPMNDELVTVMQKALSESSHGAANYSKINEKENFVDGSGWLGNHTTDCGEHSTSHDYLLENGMITNSLATFYLQYYRKSIPKQELEKVMELFKFYQHNMKTKVSFEELIGKTFLKIENGKEIIKFICEDGEIFEMLHEQDCCEHVEVDDIVGDLDDLIGFQILTASEDTNKDVPKDKEDEGFTWTFYNISTAKGHVTIKWYGTSNGYYSESVSIYKRKKPIS